MVVFKDIFAKKEAASQEKRGPTDIPTDQVLTLRTQGFTNNQIIESLQRNGYGMEQLSRAINQADVKQGVLESQATGDIMAEKETPQGFPSQEGMGFPEEMSPLGMSGSMGGMSGLSETSEDRIHEIAEAIIDEKWTDLIENVNRILEWKDTMESRISKLEQKADDLKSGFDRLHEGVLGKIAQYDKGIVNLSTEVQALEKVFQKVIPGFVDNVSELSRITAKMKAASKK